MNKIESNENLLKEKEAVNINIFYDSFSEFDNQGIEKSLSSENAIVRMLAILDRRVGKRRLISMKDRIKNEPDWIKNFYCLRMNAENLSLDKEL